MGMLGFCGLSSGNANLGVVEASISRLNPAGQPLRDSEGVLRIVAKDTVSRGPLTLALQGAPRWNRRTLTAAETLDLFEKSGRELLAKLEGPFAIALHDAASNKLLLAVDRMGIERLTYTTTPGGIGFGSRATALRQLPGCHAEVSAQSIYDYLHFHMVPAPRTVFEGIWKLPPAHFLEWKDGRAVALEPYWTPEFAVRAPKDRKTLEEQLRSLIEEAVRSQEPDERTGAFLSGGLDSSTIAGYLARVGPARANTFSIGFDHEAYDEMHYARIAATHFDCSAHEYYVTAADIVNVLGSIADAYDEPFGNSSAVPVYYCAKLAVDSGMTRMLAGDGGDELFGGNERYVTQNLFETYHKIPRMLRRSVIEPVARLFPAETSIAPLRKIRRYVDSALIPLPDRLGINFAFQFGLSRVLSPELVDSINADAPLEHMRSVYHSVPAESLLDRLLAYDWRFTLADNDLRKVSTMCELAGIEVAYPMLDTPLVDFSLQVPASMKIEGTRLRAFYKDAMRGFLPDQILSKKKHGFGLPFGVWLKTHPQLREMVYSNLRDFDARRYFKDGFLDDVIERHRSGPASFYGYFIWDLVMLEEWLKRHDEAVAARKREAV